MDRKAFIDSFARLTILGMFAIFTGFLISRRKLSRMHGCAPVSFCQTCRDLGSCNREEAVKFKENG